MDILPVGYHAYAPDLRGCGQSGHTEDGHNIEQLALDVYEFVQSLNLQALHLIGHSLGGAVAMQLALDYPELVKDLLLVGSVPADGMPAVRKNSEHSSWILEIIGLFNPQKIISKMSSGTLESTYQTLQNLPGTRHLLRRALAMMTPSWEHDNNPFFEELINDAGRMSPKAMAGHLTSLETWNILSRLKELSIPVMILLGGRDILVSREQMENTIKELKYGILVVWDDVGHSPQIEQPVRFVKLMMDFIGKNEEEKPPVGLVVNLWQKLRKMLKIILQ
ncbi:MAG TPA: alpha/beta hydrolase, partial [Smithellaceae bacterium]|nr:alpha/beta hydrolase [Smithellaceae bacterium]